MRNKIFLTMFSLVAFLGFANSSFATTYSSSLISSDYNHIQFYANKIDPSMNDSSGSNPLWLDDSNPILMNGHTYYILAFNGDSFGIGGNPHDLPCNSYDTCKALASGDESTIYFNHTFSNFIDLGSYTVQTQQQVAQTSLFATGGLTASVAQTSDQLGGITTTGVSNLWPLMLIVVGIPLTFYVINKIIDMFVKNTKEKKYSSDVMKIYREGKGSFDKK